MHIRSFIGAALLCIGMLAFAPVAMADPAPDICVLSLSQPDAIDHAIDTAGIPCEMLKADASYAVPITGGDEDEAAGSCNAALLVDLDFAGHRQHEDPGRCTV